jgi:hypothetical protein
MGPFQKYLGQQEMFFQQYWLWKNILQGNGRKDIHANR